MTALAPSPYEQSVIDRFGIFAEERVVEEVARAIHDADEWDCSVDWPCANANLWRRLAAAAVVAYRATQDGGAEEAVRRVEALADTWIREAQGRGQADDLHFAGVAIRAALAPQADGLAELLADAAVVPVTGQPVELGRRARPQADDGDPQIDPRSPRGAYL